MGQTFYKDGRIKFSSETETSEYESEQPEERPPPPQAPQITQKLKNFRLLEGSDATFVCRVVGRPRPKVC